MDNISNNPRPWGGGNHLSQTDMDDLELRKVRALERIADALDGRRTSSASGNTSGEARPRSDSLFNTPSKGGGSSLFDCFHMK